MDEFVSYCIPVVFSVGLFWCMWAYFRGKSRVRKAAKLDAEKMQSILNDVSRSEKERRAELLQRLVGEGLIIQKNEPGLVIALRQKAKFSLAIFVILFFCGGLPGVLYLIANAMSRDKVSQFVILHV